MINYKNKFSVLIPSEDIEEVKEVIVEEITDQELSIIKEESIEQSIKKEKSVLD